MLVAKEATAIMEEDQVLMVVVLVSDVVVLLEEEEEKVVMAVVDEEVEMDLHQSSTGRSRGVTILQKVVVVVDIIDDYCW